jgi:Rieske Fe-S protein
MVRHDPIADESVSLGPLAEFPIGEFQKRTVTVTEEGTWQTAPVEKTLWIRRNADDTLLVFTATCPHMNCTVDLQPDKTFACPCHHSSFSAEGQVLLGPAPRPLDTLDYRVSGEEVTVQYQNFRKGIAEKEVHR